jgi:hypothetical protein
MRSIQLEIPWSMQVYSSVHRGLVDEKSKGEALGRGLHQLSGWAAGPVGRSSSNGSGIRRRC